MDEEIIDELLAGISDGLIKELELFLVNHIDNRETQKTIIALINKAYLEGYTFPSMHSQYINVPVAEHQAFTEEFKKKLLDGQDEPIPE